MLSFLHRKPVSACGCCSSDTSGTGASGADISSQAKCAVGVGAAHDPSPDDNDPSHEESGSIKVLALSGVMFALTLILADTIESYAGAWVVRLLYLVPYILCGFPILREAFRLICKGNVFNEFSLMGGATLAAICLGQDAEAVGVMLFYQLGEYLQERAAGSSRRSIKNLLASKPVAARVIENGTETMMQVENVALGQIMLVRAGEKIPLDGEVTNGWSDVDQSPLTGESVPISVKEGDAVLGGSINMSGTLSVKTTALYENTHMARIIDMIENAAQSKSPTERFITRFARYYTPAVVGIAFLVAVIPPLFIADATFATWVYRALVLLVISCPCALLISIPLGYFGGIGAASTKGILVKGSNVFDDIMHVNTVFFDKTGTLTHGQFSVAEVTPAQGVSEEELLRAATIAEYFSNHPIARSIVKYTAGAGFKELAEALGGSNIATQELPGKGISVTFDAVRYLAGTAALMQENDLEPVPNTKPGAIVYVAADNRFLGSLLVTDEIKAEAKEMIAALTKRGITTVMLTGDREEVASVVARETGITKYRSGLLPEGKVEAMQSMAASSASAFVGDGINDAPILATAQVGIAMGGRGAEAAIEVADAVIMTDSLTLVDRLFTIAGDVRKIIWQNVIFALGIKTLFMGFGIVGLSGLWEAVFADVGVALLAVLNASRITRMNK